MNDLQKVASAISGYDPQVGGGARDDYYYDSCKTENDQWEQITNYANNVFDIYLSDQDVKKIHYFLESFKDCVSSNEAFYKFEELKDEDNN